MTFGSSTCILISAFLSKLEMPDGRGASRLIATVHTANLQNPGLFLKSQQPVVSSTDINKAVIFILCFCSHRAKLRAAYFLHSASCHAASFTISTSHLSPVPLCLLSRISKIAYRGRTLLRGLLLWHPRFPLTLKSTVVNPLCQNRLLFVKTYKIVFCCSIVVSLRGWEVWR